MKNTSDAEKQAAVKKRAAEGLTGATDETAVKEQIEERIEEKIDRDLQDSFPASDPPGWTLGVERRRVK